MVQWALNFSWCKTMHMETVHMYFLDDEGTDPLTGWYVSLTQVQLSTYTIHATPAITTTDCLGAQWCPDHGHGGDPPGHHPLTNLENAQMLHTDTSGSHYACHNEIHTTRISFSLQKKVRIKIRSYLFVRRHQADQHKGLSAPSQVCPSLQEPPRSWLTQRGQHRICDRSQWWGDIQHKAAKNMSDHFKAIYANYITISSCTTFIFTCTKLMTNKYTNQSNSKNCYWTKRH